MDPKYGTSLCHPSCARIFGKIVHACTMALQTCRMKGKNKTQCTDQILSFKRSYHNMTASAVLKTSRWVGGCIYIDATNMDTRLASGIGSSGSGPSVIIVTTGVLINPYPDQEGDNLGSMSGTRAISTTSSSEQSLSPPRKARSRRKFMLF